MKYLVIGDVHADYLPFKRAVNYATENELHLICVGDLIDNGEDGAICVSEMLKLLETGKATIPDNLCCLAGSIIAPSILL